MYIRIDDGSILKGELQKGNWWFRYEYNQYYLRDDKLVSNRKFSMTPIIKSQGDNLIDVLEDRDMILFEDVRYKGYHQAIGIITNIAKSINRISLSAYYTISRPDQDIESGNMLTTIFPNHKDESYKITKIITHEQYLPLAQEVK